LEKKSNIMIKLKNLLYEVETFTATNKKSGETAVFKTKDARDAAVKAGTHDDIDSSDDKSKGKKNSMFSKGNYDAPDVKKDKEETPKKSKPKKESPKGPNPLHQHKKKYLPKEISNFTETLKDKNGNPIKGFDVNNLKVGASLPDNFEELIEKENLVHKAAESGKFLLNSLHDLQNEFPSLVSNSRGKGLYCAFDLPSSEDRDKLAGLLLDEGSILLGSGNYSIRFRPHLNVTEDDINFGMDCFRRALNKLS